MDDWQDIPTAQPSPADDWTDVSSPSPQPKQPVAPSNKNPYTAANKAKSALENFGEGAIRGAENAGIGAAQLAGKPLYSAVNSVIGDGSGDYEGYNKTLNNMATTNRMQDSGTGISGTLGELAGDPRNYIMAGAGGAGPKAASNLMKIAGSLGRGTEMGAAYGLTAPSENEKTGQEGVEQRLTNAAKSGMEGAATVPAIEGTAGLAGKGVNWAANKFKSATELNPEGVLNTISKNYYTTKQKANELADKMRFFANDEEGQPRTIVATGLQDYLNNAISDLSTSVSPAEQKAARTLKNIRDRRVGVSPEPYDVYPETGRQYVATPEQLANQQPFTIQPHDNISYSDLVDIKQALNEGFNPSQFANKKDRALGSLSGKVNEGLAKAGEQTPEFGDALYDFNKHYGDEVAGVFRNDTIGKHWTPDDYHEYTRTNGNPSSVDFKSRASGILKNIKTPEDLQAVTEAMTPKLDPDQLRSLPSDQRADAIAEALEPAQNLMKAKLEDMSKDASASKQRIIKLATAAMDVARLRWVSAAKNAYRGVTGSAESTPLGETLQKAVGNNNLIPDDIGNIIGEGTAQGLDMAATRSEGDKQQNAPLHMTIGRPKQWNQQAPGYARGGAVYDPSEWLTMVRKHGKEAGVTTRDRLNPEKIKLLEAKVCP